MNLLSEDGLQLYCGDALSALSTFAPSSVQCCVTSPPYWGLRDYGHDGSLGAEPTPEAYVAAMVGVFGEVRRVLATDGLLWLNLGDSYSSGGRGSYDSTRISRTSGVANNSAGGARQTPDWAKPKDLIGIPWRVAFALQADGWYLRSDIIWSKPNPMPESVTDRPTKSHEYLFLLAKSQTYYFDQDAVRTNWMSGRDDMRDSGVRTGLAYLQQGKVASNHLKPDKQRGHSRRHAGFNDRWNGMTKQEQSAMGANIRSVWTIATQPSPLPHFAAFPDALVEPCIKAGSRLGDTVLDPFAGTATTLKVARELGRKAVGIEISPDYCELAVKRLRYGVRGVMAIRDGQGILE